MTGNQTHWKRHLYSEWSTVKENEATKNMDTSKLTSAKLETTKRSHTWSENVRALVHRIVDNWP